MPDSLLLAAIADELEKIRADGLFKTERVLLSPQQKRIKTERGEAINFCANNYLGLANHPELVRAAKEALDRYGYGMASVRFICGTSEVHKQLEEKVARFLGMEDAILYSSCFDANAGLFETLLDERDAVISDQLNHASIIDGIRLCKAVRFRYGHGDMGSLEEQLRQAEKYRRKMVATDGVFSMDGDVARLGEICALAEKYGALTMVDDSHATGFFGPTGRGSPEYCGALGRVDIVTSTFGKALGGASGGFTAGRKEIVALLRQRSRPYLFSNSLPPVIAVATLRAIEMISASDQWARKVRDNALYFRKRIAEAGFAVRPGEHPIVPIMLGEARLAREMADALLDDGVYAIGFSYPVVPKGQARIRVQVSAAHEKEDLDLAVSAFRKAGERFKIVQ
ncbi:MAG: glycine C-acetyltransferase [Nitrospinae bacterium]|nr:glycine C-acetyltransferase [Nitrospinota bacterium]